MFFFFSLIISSLGLAYFVYGKKTTDFLFMFCGMILMVYPYFVTSLILSIITGICLAICPFILRNVDLG